MKKHLLLMLGIIPSIAFSQTSEAYVAPGDLRTFLDYNLGADTSLPSNTPSLGIKGDKFQWGLANKVDNSTNWNALPASDTALSDINKTANDPCPDGYRIPTAEEWQGVIANNSVQWIGDFYEEGSTYNRHTSGLLVNNSLFLPAAGYNNHGDGTLHSNNGSGLYWSTTASGSQDNASALVFSWTGQIPSNPKEIIVNPIHKSRAGNIRCIKEEARDLLLGTSDINKAKKGYVIYPNPAKGEFFIDSASKGKMEVMDFTGKTLLSRDFKVGSKESVNVSMLPNGVYLVKISTADGKTQTEKLVIEK